MPRSRKYLLIGVIGLNVIAAALLALSPTDYRVDLTSVVQIWGDVVRDVDKFGLTITAVSIEKEIEIGNEIAKTIRPVIDNDQQRYISEVGRELAKHARRRGIPYKFHVVSSPIVNAFAVAGGQIYITTGMLNVIENEAELASVLGHEIAHVDLKHTIEMLQYELLLRRVVSEDLAVIVQIAHGLLTVSYSQQQEMEADAAGVIFSAKAGYDPRAGITLFERLARLETTIRPPRKKESPPSMTGEIVTSLGEALEDYFATHPSSHLRVRKFAELHKRNELSWRGKKFYVGRSNLSDLISRASGERPGEWTEYDASPKLVLCELPSETIIPATPEGCREAIDAEKVRATTTDAETKTKTTTPLDQPSTAPALSLKPGDEFQDCARCPKMAVVPAGEFMMGSPPSEARRDEAEGPQHRARIPMPFAVGKFEVTFDEWDACVADGGCNGYKPEDERWGRGRRPVINVSWDDAKVYVAWLSGKTGKTYRLLSEAEWEYAARAGTTTPFSTGRTITTDEANFDGDFTYNGSNKGRDRGKTVPVGSFPANAFGLHDMHGNVGEWVEDCWNDSYAAAPMDGTARMAGDCLKRDLRGGSWNSSPSFLRSAIRRGITSDFRLYSFGFRVARTLEVDPKNALP